MAKSEPEPESDALKIPQNQIRNAAIKYYCQIIDQRNMKLAADTLAPKTRDDHHDYHLLMWRIAYLLRHLNDETDNPLSQGYGEKLLSLAVYLKYNLNIDPSDCYLIHDNRFKNNKTASDLFIKATKCHQMNEYRNLTSKPASSIKDHSPSPFQIACIALMVCLAIITVVSFPLILVPAFSYTAGVVCLASGFCLFGVNGLYCMVVMGMRSFGEAVNVNHREFYIQEKNKESFKLDSISVQEKKTATSAAKNFSTAFKVGLQRSFWQSGTHRGNGTPEDVAAAYEEAKPSLSPSN